MTKISKIQFSMMFYDVITESEVCKNTVIKSHVVCPRLRKSTQEVLWCWKLARIKAVV